MTEQKKIVLKDRKHARLWQAYKWWEEMMLLRQRHTLRISAIERGASTYDVEFEQMLMGRVALVGADGAVVAIGLDGLVKQAASWLHMEGRQVGPIWEHMLAVRGVGDNVAAKLLAQIDDIENFATVSKLWAFAGWAVRDGHREYYEKGQTGGYNRILKSVCWQIMDQFVRHQTPGYIGFYYDEKARLRRIHPETECRECGVQWDRTCKAAGHHMRYNDGHVDLMARRKTVKIFLQHLWLRWRTLEGLPISAPYAHDVLGHTHYLAPEECGWPALVDVPEPATSELVSLA